MPSQNISPQPVLIGWGSILPMTWIEQALEATGTASVRRRHRLPAEQVVWLVIALALYRHQSMPEVLATLDLIAASRFGTDCQQECHHPGPAAPGAEPWAGSSQKRGGPGAGRMPSATPGRELSLWAMDGTIFRTPDSPENRAHFGAQRYSSRRKSQLSAGACRQFDGDPDASGGGPGLRRRLRHERNAVRQATDPAHPDHSLTVFDKSFLSAEILLGLSLAGQDRHYLIPAKSNLKWERLSGSEEDGLVRMRVSPQARAKAPGLPEYWSARAIRVVSANGRCAPCSPR